MMFHTARNMGPHNQRGRPRRPDAIPEDGDISRSNDDSVENEEEESVYQECNNPLNDDNNENLIHFVRKACGIIVNDGRTRMLITVVIIVNSILMGVATYPFVRDSAEVSKAFAIVDMVFLLIYTAEIILQFIYHGFKMFVDGWLVFDFFIVAISWAFESFSVIRAFRVVRSIRIFRAFRLVGRFKPMREVVNALLAVMPNLMYITLLLSLTFYINAVFFTSMFKDLYERGLTEENYFSTLDVSSFTLFQVMCLDDWSEIARDVMNTYTWAWVPFTLFLITTTFTVLNMFIAVFCKAIHELDAIRNEEEGIDQKNIYEIYSDELNQLTDKLLLLSKTQDDAIRRINDLSWQLQAQKIRKKLSVKNEANI